MADQLERKAVRQAIADGWTWAQVAEALGVTKQAAHKKHAGNLARD
jgi:DNA-binding XRE family transcriptional regulator